MKYIVDIKNDTPAEVIDQWMIENNYSIVHTFNHFEKMYIVESESVIEPADFIERLVIDDNSSAIKLHSTADTFTINTTTDDNWWKAVVITAALETEAETVKVVRRGAGYTVYLMDSGVNSAHEDFSNITVRHLFSHTNTMTDMNGHGTALASIISGTSAGLTSAEIVSVKIFEKGVPTLVSDIMKALDAIAIDYLDKNLGKPAVINMSWSIDRNEFVEDKIRSLIKLGLLPVTAAGNSGVSIGNVTPAAMPDVATIGSVGPTLTPSNFSNYTGPSDISFTPGETNFAPGLDYWAPGEYILTASKDGGFTYMAGTSASAAVVSAVLVYHFSRIALEYGKVYRAPRMGLSDQFDESNQIVATIDSVSSEFLIQTGHNPFIPSKTLVDLTEKYKDCTNKIPITFGVYDSEFTNKLGWYTDILYVKKGSPVNQLIYDPLQVESSSITGLPEGLTVDQTTGIVSGTLNVEVGEDKFKVFNATMTLIRAEKTVETTLQIIYLDPDVITEDFNLQDYTGLIKDSNLILHVQPCWQCGDYQDCFGLGNQCNPCEMCFEGKTYFEWCQSYLQPCF